MEERCTRQSVPTVERNAKFPSNPTEADRYTAENAILNEDHQGDIKLTSGSLYFVHRAFSFFIRFWTFLSITIIDRKHTLNSLINEVDKRIMPTDPVCGAILDERSSKFKITYEGETYYFCSVTCKKKFKRHPMKFVK